MKIMGIILTQCSHFRSWTKYFYKKEITLDNCEESGFDEEVAGDSRLFPLEGGLLKTAQLSTDVLARHISP